MERNKLTPISKFLTELDTKLYKILLRVNSETFSSGVHFYIECIESGFTGTVIFSEPNDPIKNELVVKHYKERVVKSVNVPFMEIPNYLNDSTVVKEVLQLRLEDKL